MLATDLPEFIWGNRSEPYYTVHPTHSRRSPVSKDQALALLAGGDRYFAPVPRITLGNSKADCARTFDTLYCDIDREPGVDPYTIVADIEPTLREMGFWPSCIVFSGRRGLHLYWKLDDDLPVKQVEEYNKALSSMVGGDHCWAMNVVLRNPGTRHEMSRKLAEIIDFSGEVHSVASLLDIEPVERAPSQRPQLPRKSLPAANTEWWTAAQELTGWSAPASLDYSVLPQWQHSYLYDKPAKGWKRGSMTRSEVEQSIVYRLVGKGVGASDPQVIEVADEAFVKHLEERPKQGYRYIARSIAAARRRWFEKGWITSPLGGWPRQKDAKYRVIGEAGLDAELDLVRGQRLSEWVEEVNAKLGVPSSTAYRHKDKVVQAGLVGIKAGRIYRLPGSG